MIICSCNVLSDHDVRSAVHTAAPRTTGQVYGCLGCSAQCGRCARTIRKIMDEALARRRLSGRLRLRRARSAESLTSVASAFRRNIEPFEERHHEG